VGSNPTATANQPGTPIGCPACEPVETGRGPFLTRAYDRTSNGCARSFRVTDGETSDDCDRTDGRTAHAGDASMCCQVVIVALSVR
jgi:hypothetical protein